MERIIADDSVAIWRLTVKLLIVNADDFGRSAGVNAGTLRAHADGIVTCATAMVLEPAAAPGIRDAGEAEPMLPLGLHLVLTGGGRPACRPRDLPTLAPDGRFFRTLAELPVEIPAHEVRAELEAQLGIFQALAGGPPSHLDSHHHAALHPAVAGVFAAVARERSLPARASSPEAGKMLRAAGVRTPDHFVDRFYAANARVEALEEMLRVLPEGVSELMCHPGFADEDLQRSSTYAAPRERELEILCNRRIRELVQELGIRLVAYDAV